jgi:hypothetical protein
MIQHEPLTVRLTEADMLSGDPVIAALRRTTGAQEAWANGLYVGWRKGDRVWSCTTPKELFRWVSERDVESLPRSFVLMVPQLTQ